MHAVSTIRSSHVDVGISARRPSRTHLEEQAVAHLHDVGFVDGGHALAAVLARVLEGEPRDARRGLLGDDLQALDDARDHLVLEPRVEVLGVLANDDEVDA